MKNIYILICLLFCFSISSVNADEHRGAKAYKSFDKHHHNHSNKNIKKKSEAKKYAHAPKPQHKKQQYKKVKPNPKNYRQYKGKPHHLSRR